uniref:Uncharacterized protein n=1 Tax=Glossina brevipalpis TaxID=37001 RepID=A0A1A9WZ70_9MUSC
MTLRYHTECPILKYCKDCYHIDWDITRTDGLIFPFISLAFPFLILILFSIKALSVIKTSMRKEKKKHSSFGGGGMHPSIRMHIFHFEQEAINIGLGKDFLIQKWRKLVHVDYLVNNNYLLIMSLIVGDCSDLHTISILVDNDLHRLTAQLEPRTDQTTSPKISAIARPKASNIDNNFDIPLTVAIMYIRLDYVFDYDENSFSCFALFPHRSNQMAQRVT